MKTYVEHVEENLSDLANRLNRLAVQGTQQEKGTMHRDNNCPLEIKRQWYLPRKKKKKIMKELNHRYHVLVKLNFR